MTTTGRKRKDALILMSMTSANFLSACEPRPKARNVIMPRFKCIEICVANMVTDERLPSSADIGRQIQACELIYAASYCELIQKTKE